jgi:hypothetical protein
LHKFYKTEKNMKKTIVIAFALLFSVFVSAQDKKQSEIKVSELPKGVSSWVASNMPGGKITRAGKMVENGTTTYAAVVEAKGSKHSYLFDKDGKFVGKGDRSMNSQGKAPAATTTTGVKAATAPAPTAKPPVKTTTAKPSATEEAAPSK